MMRRFDCARVVACLDQHARGELGPAEGAAVGEHVLACPACAGELERSRRAQAVLSLLRQDELPAEACESRLRQIREGVLRAVRTEPRAAAPGWSLGLAWGMAAALVLLLGLGILGRGPESEGSRSPLTVSAAADSDVQVVTLATKDGTVLSWDGPGATFLVMRSNRPGGFEVAERTLVCGRSWTDRSEAPGVVFYRVEAAAQPCRS